MFRFETQFFEYLNTLRHMIRVQPINLGGTYGVSGGTGGPPGGFFGQLPQQRVAFDTSELSSLYYPTNASGLPSGASLWHNLNRIRYWIDQKNPTIVLKDEGVEVASGVTVVNFTGVPVTVTASGLEATVTISGTGGASSSGILVKVSDNDTLGNYLDAKIAVASFSSKQVLNEGGNEQLEISSDDERVKASSDDTTEGYLEDKITVDSSITKTTQNPGGNENVRLVVTDPDDDLVIVSSNDTTPGHLEDKITPGSGIVIQTINEGGNEQVQVTLSGGSVGSDLEIQEDDISTATQVTVLNFEGSVTTLDEGSGKVTVTVSSGSAVDQVKISSNDTTSDYLENKIVASGGIVVTTLNEGGNEDLQLSTSGLALETHTHTESDITDLDHEVIVRVNSGSNVGTRSRLNLIEGTNITISAVDDAANDEVDITINSTASGGGGGSTIAIYAKHRLYEEIVSGASAPATITASGWGSGADYDTIEVEATLKEINGEDGEMVEMPAWSINNSVYPAWTGKHQWESEGNTHTASFSHPEYPLIVTGSGSTNEFTHLHVVFRDQNNSNANRLAEWTGTTIHRNEPGPSPPAETEAYIERGFSTWRNTSSLHQFVLTAYSDGWEDGTTVRVFGWKQTNLLEP